MRVHVDGAKKQASRRFVLLTVMVRFGEKGKSPFSDLRFPSLATLALLEL